MNVKMHVLARGGGVEYCKYERVVQRGEEV